MTKHLMTGKKKNAMIMMLIIAMLFSGMHFEKVKMASSFCDALETSQTYMNISSDNKITANDSCTLEQLSNITIRSAVECIRRSAADSSSKVRSRSAECLFDLFLTVRQGLTQNTRDMQYILGSVIPSVDVIITYIHQQDGKKAAFSNCIVL